MLNNRYFDQKKIFKIRLFDYLIIICSKHRLSINDNKKFINRLTVGTTKENTDMFRLTYLFKIIVPELQYKTFQIFVIFSNPTFSTEKLK